MQLYLIEYFIISYNTTYEYLVNNTNICKE